MTKRGRKKTKREKLLDRTNVIGETEKKYNKQHANVYRLKN